MICPDGFVFISILRNKHFYSDFWSMNGIDWVYPSSFRLVPGASSLSTLGGTGICPKYWQCLMICPTDVHQYFLRSLFYLKQSGDHRGLQEYHGPYYMNKNKPSGTTFWFSSTGCRILWVFQAFPPLRLPSVKSMEQKHHVIWIVQWSIVYTLFSRDDYGPLTYQKFY